MTGINEAINCLYYYKSTCEEKIRVRDEQIQELKAMVEKQGRIIGSQRFDIELYQTKLALPRTKL